MGGGSGNEEGDGPAVAALMELAKAIGGRPVRMDSAGKALYHAGAAMACNHLSALMDAAAALLGAAGIDSQTAMAALGPRAAATLANVAEMGPAAALTGPVARGDAATVGRRPSMKAQTTAPATAAHATTVG